MSGKTSLTTAFKLPALPEMLPYFSLLVWFGLLLLLRSQQQSLMAHDEGVYAVQARLIFNAGDWVIRDFNYDRTIGIQCLIAFCYWLFGVSDTSARLPSMLAGILSLLLTYNIGCLLLNRRLAWLGGMVLGATPLWVLYSRLATQDATLVLTELCGIWAILQAERQRDRRPYWLILAGSMVGLGFLIKGFMIFVSAIAVMPYLVWHHRRHRHLTSPWLYLGIVLGAIPTVAWLWESCARYGAMPIQNLFGKFFYLSGTTFQDNGPFYYFWNIPANAFPWPFFALLGIALVLRHAAYKKLVRANHGLLLLVGYPAVMFVMLSLFKTRTNYYPLQLLPFLALLAAVALDWLVAFVRQPSRRWQWLPAMLSYVFGGLGLAMFLLGAVVTTGLTKTLHLFELSTGEIDRIGLVALAAGLAWIGLPIVWIMGKRSGQRWISAQRWLLGWLLGPWLASAILGATGLWGNFTPDLKSFLERPAVVAVLQSHTVDFVVPSVRMNTLNRKTRLLLQFYTPQRGQDFVEGLPLTAPTYAWVAPGVTVQPPQQLISEFDEWRLMQLVTSGVGIKH